MKLRSALLFLGLSAPTSAFACGNALIEAHQRSAMSWAGYPLFAVVLSLTLVHRLSRVHLGALAQLCALSGALALVQIAGALQGYALRPHGLELFLTGFFGLPLSLAAIRLLGGRRRSRSPL